MKRKIALGFDFGTYTTKVSFIPVDEKTKPKILNIPEYSDKQSGLIYSFVSKDFSKVGFPAWEEFKKGKDDEIIYGFKMELDDEKKYEIAKRFLKTVFEEARKKLREDGFEVDLENIRFSAPNSWSLDENAKFFKLLQDVIGGGKDIIVREPYASAVYYLSDEIFEKAGQKALVIDAGAGTIDTLLVEITDNKNEPLREVKGSYKTLEKAGIYIDQKINEFYKLESLYEAENLKFLISYKFAKGEKKISHKDYYVTRKEFEEECMKEWLNEYKNLLKLYQQYKINYILFAGGLSAFYLVREIAKKIFPEAKEYDTSKKDYCSFVIQTFREDKSISYGCSIISANKLILLETLKFCIYLKLESPSVIESFTYKNMPIEFLQGKSPGEYLLKLFDKNDFTGKKVNLSDYKMDGKPLKVSSFGSMKIVIKYTDKEVEKELPIEDKKFKATILTDLKFEIDSNKVFKVIYEYEDRTTRVLTSADLKTV